VKILGFRSKLAVTAAMIVAASIACATDSAYSYSSTTMFLADSYGYGPDITLTAVRSSVYGTYHSGGKVTHGGSASYGMFLSSSGLYGGSTSGIYYNTAEDSATASPDPLGPGGGSHEDAVVASETQYALVNSSNYNTEEANFFVILSGVSTADPDSFGGAYASSTSMVGFSAYSSTNSATLRTGATSQLGALSESYETFSTLLGGYGPSIYNIGSYGAYESITYSKIIDINITLSPGEYALVGSDSFSSQRVENDGPSPAPSPAAVAPFALGLLGVARGRRRAKMRR
jgi:hypothetical protein